VAGLLVLTGCSANDDDDSAGFDDDDAAVELTATWDSIQPLLRFRCGCHHTADGGEGGLIGIDDVELGYAALVGVPSEDVPSMARVEPGQPDQSYLLLKLRDAHRAAGGTGDRMPPTGPALPDAQIQVIADWVAAGAAP